MASGGEESFCVVAAGVGLASTYSGEDPGCSAFVCIASLYRFRGAFYESFACGPSLRSYSGMGGRFMYGQLLSIGCNTRRTNMRLCTVLGVF